MYDNFDNKLKALAKNSKVEIPIDMKNRVLTNTKALKRKNSFYKRLGTVAASLIIAVTVLSVSFPSYAKSFPVIGSVLKFANKNLGVGGYSNDVTEINYIATIGDYKLNIENIYYDGSQLALFYKISSDKPLKKDTSYTLELNVDSNVKSKGYEYSVGEAGLIDDYTFGGIIDIAIHSDMKLPQVINGVFNIKSLCIGSRIDNQAKIIKADIKPLKVTLDSKNIAIKEFNINKTTTLENITHTVTKARKTSGGIYLDEEIQIDRSKPINYSHGYRLWDSKSGPLTYVSGTVNTDNSRIISTSFYRNSITPGDLYLIPITRRELSNTNSYSLFKIQENNTYELNRGGSVEVKTISNDDDKTLITVNAKGFEALITNLFYLRGKGNEEYFKPTAIINKKVNGIADITLTYIFEGLDPSKDYYLEKLNVKNETQVLYDDIVPIK